MSPSAQRRPGRGAAADRTTDDVRGRDTSIVAAAASGRRCRHRRVLPGPAGYGDVCLACGGDVARVARPDVARELIAAARQRIAQRHAERAS